MICRLRILAFLVPAIMACLPAESVPLSFTGVVETDRNHIRRVLPPCRGLTIKWIAENGALVSAGEPMVTFNTLSRQQEVLGLEHDLAIASAEYEENRLVLAEQVNRLQDTRKGLVARLAVIEARIAKVSRVDERQVALLEAEMEAIDQKVRVARRELEQGRVLQALGELSRDAVADAERRVAGLETDREIARLNWEQQRTRIDSLNVATLALDRRELRMELGLAEERRDTQDELRGIEKRIDALTREIAEKQKVKRINRDRIQRRLHEARRNAHDVTPVATITVLEGESDATVYAVSFQRDGTPVPAGYTVDTGAVYTASRGWGWDRDVSSQVVQRDTGKPLYQGVALVSTTATWRCDLPAGSYRLRVGFGDSLDWQGARACVVEPPMVSPLFVERHLKKPRVAEARVSVTGEGGLKIAFGADQRKSILATEDCVVLPQDWIKAGFRITWDTWPILYTAAPEHFEIKALVHQELVPLLTAVTPGEAVAATTRHPTGPAVPSALRVARVRRTVAASAVTVTTARGEQLRGWIKEIGTTPVARARPNTDRWDAGKDDTRENVAREVFVAFSPGDAALLRLGESAQCEVDVLPPDDMRVLPIHFVSRIDSDYWVRLADGRPQRVEGFRVGNAFAVTGGLKQDQPLAAPDASRKRDRNGRRRYPGQVTAGESTKVGMSGYWGRIRDLVPDGSYVTNNQVVVWLYNPYLELQRERIEESKARARQQYVVAMEARRVKSIEAQRRHDIKVLDERRTQLAIRKLEERMPVPLARARAAWEAARKNVVLARDRLSRLRAIPGTSPAELQQAVTDVGMREVALQKAHLSLVKVERSRDWLALYDARDAWQAAVDSLSFREDELSLIRKEERVARVSAQLRLDDALGNRGRARRFEQNRELTARSDGRLFFKTGWDDQSRTVTKMAKDFIVWGGMPIAEVLDMSQLAMEIELPEDMYLTLSKGDRVDVGFDLYPGVIVPGTVDRVGRSFRAPADMRDTTPGEDPVNIDRVFTAVVRYSPPPGLANELVPGTKGFGILREE